MNSFSRRLLLLLVSITTANIADTHEALAKPGDLIAHRVAPPVVTSSTITTYRVSGWERDLTSVTPNLSNYYWEPMSKRIVNTTRTTSRGAVAAPPLQIKRTNYVRPVQAEMPVINHPQALAATPALMRTQPITRSTSTVLTYNSGSNQSTQNTSMQWSTRRYPDLSQAPHIATKESVYGVLKTPVSSMRATAQSL